MPPECFNPQIYITKIVLCRMVELYGKSYDGTISKYVGRMEQLGGIRLVQLDEGAERGVKAAIVSTGTGLSFLALLDRGMGISNAEYRGAPLGWKSQTGDIGPEQYDPSGRGWLQGFFGGLLTMCGLTHCGAACVDQGEPLGLHGRIAYTPADSVAVRSEWRGGDYFMSIEGKVREASVFGPNLVLCREIEAKLGENRFTIRDTVRNEGWRTEPFMILYHFNIGFPVLDAGSRFLSSSTRYVPRDEEAWKGYEKYAEFQPPTEGFKEKVYFHDLATDHDGFCYAGIVNESFNEGQGIGIALKFRKSELNRLIEWKMMGEGEYVVGLEPANALVLGRDKERKWGTLQFLKPSDQRDLYLEVQVLTGTADIESFKQKVLALTEANEPSLIRGVDEFVEKTRPSV